MFIPWFTNLFYRKVSKTQVVLQVDIWSINKTSWWFQPNWRNMLVELDHFPKTGWSWKICCWELCCFFIGQIIQVYTFGPKNSHGKMHFVFFRLYNPNTRWRKLVGSPWLPSQPAQNPKNLQKPTSPYPYILFISHLFCGFMSHHMFFLIPSRYAPPSYNQGSITPFTGVKSPQLPIYNAMYRGEK